MDAGALEFWIGAWHCSWSGGHGTNSITRELDDRVVVERFKAEGPEPFMSISVFDERVGWRQTWVDSNGSYWHFEGSTLDDGSPCSRRPSPSTSSAPSSAWSSQTSPRRVSSGDGRARPTAIGGTSAGRSHIRASP